MNPRDKRGFTLIEVLITLVILALGMMATIVGIMAGLDHNLMNEMRNDAIKIAQEQEEAARNMPYANIATIPSPQTITRQVRNQSVTYTVQVDHTVTGGNVSTGTCITQVVFTVIWNFKGNGKIIPQHYTLQTFVRQQK
jgi:type IV pilus assembly protein PilV